MDFAPSPFSSLVFDFTVDSTSARERSDLLSQLVQQSPNPLSMYFGEVYTPRSFSHRMHMKGQLHLMELVETDKSNPHHDSRLFEFNRSHSELSRLQSGGFNVCLLLQGTNHFKHCGHEYVMQPTGFSIMNAEELMLAQVRGPVHCMNLALPDNWDRIGDYRVADWAGHNFRLRDSKRTGLAAYMRRLITHPELLSEAGVEDTLYDILALELNLRAASDHSKGTLELIRQYARLHFTNPELSPAEVASAFSISVRYVHRLFSTQNTTFMRYVNGLRLDNARELLCNPLHNKKTILEIAFQVGFNDINNFGRCFKERFSSTPSEMRRYASMLLDKTPAMNDDGMYRNDDSVSSNRQ